MNASIVPLFVNELLKLKRSLAALMLLLAPLSVVMLVFLMFSAGSRSPADVGWETVVRFGTGVWAYMVFPLLIALQAAIINGIEHGVDGWKRMFALPIHPGRFFLAKFAALVVMMATASLLLAAGLYAGTGIAHALSSSWPVVPQGGFLALVKLLAACFAGGLLIMLIHHVISWTMPSFVFPIGLGIVAVMAVFHVGSSEYWVYHPWTWSLIASAASDAANRSAAISMSPVLALGLAPLLALAARHLRRLV